MLAGCATAAYAASTAIEIELPDATRVSPAASFGPALAAVGTSQLRSSAWILGLVALAAQLLIVGVFRRDYFGATAHTIGLGFSFALVLAYDGFVSQRPDKTIELLALVTVAALMYWIVNLALRARRGRTRSQIFVESVRAGLPLGIVLASTAGLIVLVLPQLSWVTFVVMFLPVVATKHEFERFGQARRTYHETVRTLSGLAEGAGYVRDRHSKRVADLCVRVGRELSLTPRRLHELELVGLLHETGAVSLPDPSDVRDADPEQIARSTAYLLEETEYLADFAGVVLDVARGEADIPVEGRILRIADAFETLEGSVPQRLRQLAETAAPADAEVIRALQRVLRVP